jgi:serine/threonine protein phosphatase PrpC
MLRISSLTDPGLLRPNNEDFYLFSREYRIIIIADGVGGHEYGEVASKLAAESAYALLENEFNEDNLLEADDPIELLNRAVVFANRKVIEMKVQRPSHQRMGTTLSCLYLDHEYVYFSYVGDSRVYHIDLENKAITQLSTDHTLAQNHLDPNLVPDLHARASDILTRMVGAGNSVNPGFGKHPVKAGDLILTCTDGLSDLVSNELIQEILLQHQDDLDKALQSLLRKVKEAGARDNITVVLASSY